MAALLRGAGFPDVRAGDAMSYGRWPDLTGLPGLHLECKRAEGFRPYPWLEQAQRDAVRFADGLPVVIFRGNRRPWVALMALPDFLKLYSEGER